MIDETELFEKIESKQFEIDYDNTVTKSKRRKYRKNN